MSSKLDSDLQIPETVADCAGAARITLVAVLSLGMGIGGGGGRYLPTTEREDVIYYQIHNIPQIQSRQRGCAQQGR